MTTDPLNLDAELEHWAGEMRRSAERDEALELLAKVAAGTEEYARDAAAVLAELHLTPETMRALMAHAKGADA